MVLRSLCPGSKCLVVYHAYFVCCCIRLCATAVVDFASLVCCLITLGAVLSALSLQLLYREWLQLPPSLMTVKEAVLLIQRLAYVQDRWGRGGTKGARTC